MIRGTSAYVSEIANALQDLILLCLLDKIRQMNLSAGVIEDSEANSWGDNLLEICAYSADHEVELRKDGENYRLILRRIGEL